MYNRELEVQQAVNAGERALRSLKNAKKSLNSARGWGLYDTLGGKTLSGVFKHMKLGDAKNSLNQAKADLAAFGRELSDVQDLQGLNIEIGDFLTFADFFFDGFFADIMVQNKIRQAQRNIDDAIRRVENLLDSLKKYGR